MISAVMPTYARYDEAIERGEGVYLYTTDGRKLLDFGAGIAVASLGHCHPHLIETLKTQAETLWHCSNLYDIPGQQKLAERLVANSFGNAVFFNNSGGEAVELAVKMIRKYHSATGRPERFRVISVEGAFHGRSLAMISAGRQEKHTSGFGPLVDGFDQVAFGNLNEMCAAITPETGGILVEPVQGEGGIRPMDAAYLRGLRSIAEEFGLVLAYDEVQCGIARTGKLFAHEWSGVEPDVMALAKGLGGGFPIGACVATEEIAAPMTAGSHGSTFGGNPLAMAVSNAVLDVILADGFLTEVRRISDFFRDQLEDLRDRHPEVLLAVRGMGLMLGIQCAGEAGANGSMVSKLMEKGLLTVPAGDNVVRLIPPLIIDETHIGQAIGIIEKACREIESEARER